MSSVKLIKRVSNFLFSVFHVIGRAPVGCFTRQPSDGLDTKSGQQIGGKFAKGDVRRELMQVEYVYINLFVCESPVKFFCHPVEDA